MNTSSIFPEEFSELGQVRILPIAGISPAPINDTLYKPVDTSGPAVQDLARDIRKNGLLEPIVHHSMGKSALTKLQMPNKIEYFIALFVFAEAHKVAPDHTALSPNHAPFTRPFAASCHHGR